MREEKKGVIGQFLELVKLSFKWSGRFSRREYAIIWLGIICSFILFYFVLGILIGLGMNDLESESSMKVIDSVWSIGFIIIIVGAIVRRFHDMDKSGWYVLLLFIPIISLYYFICLFFGIGKEIGKTRWG